MPLVRGGYPVNHALRKYTGGASMASQANIPPRSNQEWFGAPSSDAAAALVTAVATSVAVPVEVGDVITKITVLVGATAAGVPTNAFAAVYSGVATPALLQQSISSGAAAINASTALVFTLTAPVVVNYVNAPFGYLYVSIVAAATAVPSLAAATVPAAVGYKAFTNSPLFLAATHGSGLTTAAPATIVTPATVSTAPIVYLT